MNTKITEEKIKQKAPRVVDKAVMPGPTYFIILIVTLILLLSFTVSLFAVFAKQSMERNHNNVDIPQDNAPSGNSNKNPSGTIGGGLSVGGNSLGKTNPKRNSYISKSAANVEKVGEQIRSDNVILIDLDTYESIAEKSADTVIYPASMTKVMSILVACENLKSL